MQCVLAECYAAAGMKDKASSVLKEVIWNKNDGLSHLYSLFMLPWERLKKSSRSGRYVKQIRVRLRELLQWKPAES
ncbi:hypothetical protein MLD38_020122 [Melastoma candidum]|uniref:Uncharacterized protein n=1 Tax=Melastoma candidum TaxID=119954 RepID=A0ACB9QBK2_9MYRT|nr:hypothetical protein MLD38_020122 [Melastoma candidum]